jgi:orotate phosphoribosyltransferase-like protein
MQQSRSALKQKEVLWRQQKVLELAGNGYSEREIAKQLQISDTTIHRDLTLLKQQARKQIKDYITHQVPFEYKKTLAGLEDILRNMSNIISKSSNSREIMQASSIKM